MGKTFHVGRHIVLLHQVIPHRAGFTDVLADLYQFAHHLRADKEEREVYGCKFQRSKTSDDMERRQRTGEPASVSTA